MLGRAHGRNDFPGPWAQMLRIEEAVDDIKVLLRAALLKQQEQSS
jgi:hypothetical protein